LIYIPIPEEMNRGANHFIFYKKKEDLDCYLELKERKAELLRAGGYEGEERYRIAWEFGRLLSYTDEAVGRLIRETTAKDR